MHQQLPRLRRLAFDGHLLLERIDGAELLRQLLVNSYRILIIIVPLLLSTLWSQTILADSNELLKLLLSRQAGSGLSLILGLWLLLKPIVQAAKEQVSLDLGKVLKEAPYEARVSALQHLQDQFADMVKAWVGQQGRLVIFIDDLDRCTPDKVPEVLEALKLFMTTGGCVYVLGLDFGVVCQAIAGKYKFNLEEGAAYLEKIVPIPFSLPPLEDNRIAAFVTSYSASPKATAMPKIFSLGLERNPRKAKQALNIYRTLLDLADVRYSAWEMEPIEPDLLAYWSTGYLDAWDPTTSNTFRLVSTQGDDWYPNWETMDTSAPYSLMQPLPQYSRAGV